MPVLLIDAEKGALAVLVLAGRGAPHWTIFFTTALVVAEHNWTVFLNFRVGKDAAAIFIISLALVP